MIKLVISDIDGTAVQYAHGPFQSTWDAIGFHGPDWQAWQDAVLKYSNQPQLWEEWAAHNRKILKGYPVAPILEKILPPPYTRGFAEFAAYVKSQGITMGFVSGGSHLVAEYMVSSLELDFHHSNEMHVGEDGKFTGTGKTNVFFDSKGSIISNLRSKYDVTLEETLFVGDHHNDIPGWEEAGIRVGMNLKRADLLPYVDYHFSDFFGVIRLIERLNGY